MEEKITSCFYECKELYGSVRLSSELQAQGTYISLTTTAKYLKKLCLKSIVRRKYKVGTTDSNHTNAISENLLNREFTVNEPSRVWVSDITYIRVLGGGFEYLTTVINLQAGVLVVI